VYRDYKEYHTDTTVRFVVNLGQEKLRTAEGTGVHKKFKLESSITTSNMVGGCGIVIKGCG
jgi:DNA topoisomerase-2